MFKLVFAAILFASVSAHAFQLPEAGFTDVATRMKLAESVKAMRAEPDFSKRYEHLIDLEKFVNDRVQTVEIPDFDTVEVHDPMLENYTSLNEFDNNLELVKQNLSAPNTTCAKIAKEVQKTAGSENASAEEAPETYMTLEVVKALCKQ